MRSKAKSELIIPNEDAIWNDIVSARSRSSGTPAVSPIDMSSSSEINEKHVDEKDTDEKQQQYSLDDVADPYKQHEIVDSCRSTDGIDYTKVRLEATQLIALRLELERKHKMGDFRKMGKEKFPYFANKFPQFFESIRTCETHRLDEFSGVMNMMLSKLDQVKNNVMTHTEMRNQVFEKNLAGMYYKRKTASTPSASM